ncbi:MAG: sugar transferase [Algoriphagus aquaeductus]|uniref:sugar transferase n=1 Tax=Algoriphagus aquaeductus TaxID=475299 RepID=UPI00391DCDB6
MFYQGENILEDSKFQLKVIRDDSYFQQLRIVLNKVRSLDILEFFIDNLDDRFDSTYFLSSEDNFALYEYYNIKFQALINLERVNHHRRINKFFEAVNFKLEPGGIYISSVQTYANRKRALIKKYPKGVNWLVIGFDTLIHRVLPKLKLTQKLYFYLTRGKYRMISRAETFGRLYSCGFEVISEKEIDNVLYFTARKVKKPAFDLNPTYGPLVKLRRVGKNGKIFKVYKLRTMYPYAEYLQEYVYQHYNLDEGGKFKNDFRVSPLGRIFRKFWLDELPMLWNVLKGDMKLIGVRPLSNHYFNLYTKELQNKRTKTKPGLLPPFYADLPKTLDEIMASELRYLDAYEKAPLMTDLKYFIQILKNILFKGARSK